MPFERAASLLAIKEIHKVNLFTVLRYRQKGQKEWLLHDDGQPLPHDLTEKILLSVREQGARFKDGERFNVISKSKASLLDGTVTVDFQSIPQNEPKPAIFSAPPTAPQTLADWQAWLVAVQRRNPTEDIQPLITSVMSAQVFEFGEVDEERLEKEQARATDLHNRGFLKLPYDCVIYRFTGSLTGRTHLIAKQDSTVVMWGYTDKGQTVKHHYVWPLSLMLSTRGTKLRTEQPSAKLQAKRMAKGRSVLPTVTYVDAEHYYSGVRNSESKGTHASPVPHLRRGHLRTLHNGHTIWIRDMLVNCKSADEAVTRRLYEVKHT